MKYSVKFFTFSALIGIVSFLFVLPVYSEIPKMISYQGVISPSAGPPPVGTIAMKFVINIH